MHLSVHATLTQNLSAPFFHNINYSFWSIAVEWQLYLIYPLFLWLSLRWGMRVAFALASILAIAINVAGIHLTSSYLLLESPFSYWFEWTIGALVAHSFVKGLTVFRWHRQVLVVLFGLIYTAYTLPPLGNTRSIIATLFFAVLVEWACHAAPPISLVERLLIPLGLCSYSLYLLHQPYLLFLSNRFPVLWTGDSVAWVWTALPLLTLAPIFLISFGYYKLIESGSIEIGKKLWTAHFAKLSPTPKLASAGA
jgi:peptidoglycan/LPS O-acetylase OafA/YrhL